MRLKIIAGSLLSVVLTGTAAFVLVHNRVAAESAEGLNQRLERDRVLFDRSWKYLASEFLDAVESQSGGEAIGLVFSALDEGRRRRAANQAAERIGHHLKRVSEHGEAPDIVLVTDETGRVIARDKDINRMYGYDLAASLPCLRRTLRLGHPCYDLWYKTDENKVLQVAVVAARNSSGSIVGSLVVAYELSAGLARTEHDLLGRHVAFLAHGKVYSSSLGPRATKALSAAFDADLRGELAAAQRGRATEPWQVSIDDNTYVGVAAPLPRSRSVAAVYVLLANQSEATGVAKSAYWIALMTVVAAIMVVIFGFVIGGSILSSIEDMEESILTIINGKLGLRLEAKSSEFSGLADRINQMINMFTGTLDTDESGRVLSLPPGARRQEQSPWQGDAFIAPKGERVANTRHSPAPPALSRPSEADHCVDDEELAASLRGEDESAYYQRIYEEYLAQKKSVGEDLSGVSLEAFRHRVDVDAKRLAEKHQVPTVRFTVRNEAGDVSLLPVIIR